MTIPLTSSGGLFKRLGHLLGCVYDIESIRGGTATTNVGAAANILTRYAQFETDFAASPANQSLLDGFFNTITGFQNAQGGTITPFASLAQSLLIKMADQDSPLPAKTLTNAMALLISQMTGVASVNQSVPALGAQTNVGTPNGNPVLVGSVLDGRGLALQYMFPETLTFTVTGDSQGSAVLNQEPVAITGPAAITDPWAYNWPGGSGVSTGIKLVDASQNNTAGNLLVNSDFETFTVANTPDNWILVTGAAGTDIFNGGASFAYTGSGSLQFLGTGAALNDTVKQQFNVSSNGTPAKLAPLTQYALNFWVRVSATPGAGTLIVDLVDGSNTVIQDAQGANNSVTKALTGVSTSWVNVNALFRTPALLPATQFLRVRLSVAIDSGKSAYIDRIGFAQTPAIYTGGPQLVMFSANTKVLINDSWTAAATNTYGAFQKAFEQLFGMRSLGMTIPFSGSSSINDNLIA